MIRVKLKWENNVLEFYSVGHANYSGVKRAHTLDGIQSGSGGYQKRQGEVQLGRIAPNGAAARQEQGGAVAEEGSQLSENVSDSSKPNQRLGDGPQADRGDVVCAAASMLCCTLIYRLEKLLGDRVAVERESGQVHLRAEVPSQSAGWGRYGEVEDSVETIMDGYRLLSGKYPENVQLVND